MNKVKLLILFIGVLLFLKGNSQVTIGSGEKPLKGSLLTLKNITNVTDASPNATKGLLLPRVMLTNNQNLDDIEGGGSGNPLLYIGLIIYNPTPFYDQCLSLPAGVYVWNGTLWNLLGGEKVKTLSGSLKQDLEALKAIQNANPSGGIDWNITDIDLVDPKTLKGVDVTDIGCGERVTSINFYNTPFLKENINNLDVSKLTALEKLNCSETNVSELDVSKNINLSQLNCSETNVSELDVSKNTKLKLLECTGSPIGELDLSKNTNLLHLYCAATQIRKLDVSYNINLSTLSCFSTNIIELDVSMLTKLNYLNCSNAPLTTGSVKILKSYLDSSQDDTSSDLKYLLPNKYSDIYYPI